MLTTYQHGLDLNPDPLSLYRFVCDQGRTEDSYLLESADMTTRQGEQSIIGLRGALRVVCRGLEVEVKALQPEFQPILDHLDRAFASLRKQRGIYAFEPIRHLLSEEERFRAPSPVDVLRELLTLRPGLEKAHLPMLLAGIFSFDFLELYERLPEVEADPAGFPHFVFTLADRLIVINHRERRTHVVVHQMLGEDPVRQAMPVLGELERACRIVSDSPIQTPRDPDPCDCTVDVSDEEFAHRVERLQRHITQGDIFQGVLSRTFEAPCHDPLLTYQILKKENPSPYMFYFRTPFGTLLGASPETAVKVSGQPPSVEIRPIAGTKPRGFDAEGNIDPDLDGRLEVELRLDEKELAEHMMLIDLARNDIARVSRPGTRHVPRILTVDRYAHVMHLVSYVKGELREDLDAFHAYVASMNMGTLVGSPKIRAAELLRHFEGSRRGPYGGAVGYVNDRGDLDTAIVIRSALVKDGLAHVQAGAGIVHDSIPAEEARETARKARSVLRALGVRS